MKYLFIFVFALLLLWQPKIYAQDQEIDILKPDLKLLEHYIKLYTDSVRVAHALNTQEYENTIYLAAENQANYLKKVGELSHLQSGNDSLKNLSDRVRSFGGKVEYVSENLALVPIFTRLENEKIPGSNFERVLWSYQRTAHFIVDGWVNSPRHYRNLINETSTHTAVAVKLSEQSGNLFIVQLFSKPTDTVRLEDDLFTYKTLGLKPISWNLLPAVEINKRIEKYGSYVKRVQIDKGFLITNFKTFRKIFRWYRKNAGVILEQDQSALLQGNLAAAFGGNTRVNGLNYYNNDQILLLTRKQLLQKAKANLDKYDYLKVLGIRLPIVKGRAKFRVKFPNGSYSNLLFTDGNHPYFLSNSNTVPSGKYQLSYTPFDYAKPSYELPEPLVKVSRASYRFKMYYETNRIESDDFSQAVSEMKSILLRKNIKLDTVLLEAKASVEGLEEENKVLFYNRAKLMFDGLKDIYNGPKPALQVHTQENWELMADQLRFSSLNSLLKESKDSVRSFMTRNKESKPYKNWLDEQRFGFLELRISTYDTIDYSISVVENLYEDSRNYFLKNLKSKVAADSLLKVQALYYDLFENQRYISRPFKRLPFEPKLSLHIERELRYMLNKDLITEKEAFRDLLRLAALVRGQQQSILKNLHKQLTVNLSFKYLSSDRPVADFYYLNQFHSIYYTPKAYNKWKRENGDYAFNATLNKLYKEIINDKRDDLPISMLNNHWGNYYLRELKNETIENSFIGRRHIRLLEAFKRFYVQKIDSFSKEEIFQIALFYNWYFQYSWALELLKEEIIASKFDFPLADMVAAAIVLDDKYADTEKVLLELHRAVGNEAWCEFMNRPYFYSDDKLYYYSTRKLYCEVCNKDYE